MVISKSRRDKNLSLHYNDNGETRQNSPRLYLVIRPKKNWYGQIYHTIVGFGGMNLNGFEFIENLNGNNMYVPILYLPHIKVASDNITNKWIYFLDK